MLTKEYIDMLDKYAKENANNPKFLDFLSDLLYSRLRKERKRLIISSIIYATCLIAVLTIVIILSLK